MSEHSYAGSSSNSGDSSSQKRVQLLVPGDSSKYEHREHTAVEVPEESCIHLRESVSGDEELEAKLLEAIESLAAEGGVPTSVDLSSNQLTYASVGESPALSSLGRDCRILNLSDNKIDLIPQVIVTKLYFLKELDLSNNRIDDIVPFIYRLRNLVRLDLSGNVIETLPVELTKLQNLRSLSLNRNLIREIPASFATFKNVTKLYLTGNQLGPAMPQLEELGLNGNGIENIPPFISKLSNLRIFSFVHNNLESIPEALYDCKRLERLNFSQNRIHDLSPAIQKLTELSELYIDSNNLRELPEELASLSYLRVLSVQDNPRLTGLPSGLEGLEEIFVSDGVDMATLPSLRDAFRKMIQLGKGKDSSEKTVSLWQKHRKDMPSWYHPFS